MATWLYLLLGFAILSCCGLLLVKRKRAQPSGRAYGFSIAGALGGLLGGLFSTFGPPVVFQCYRQTWPINEIRITLLAVFSMTSLIRLAIIPCGTLPSNDVILCAGLAVPVILVFTRLGRIIAARVPAASVRLLALTMLALSGATLIVKNIHF